MSWGKSEQQFCEFYAFLFQHVGIAVFDFLEQSQEQVEFRFIERSEERLRD